MSHLHFASTEFYAQRIVQMGEDSRRVVVSGAPGLDNLRTVHVLELEELASQYGLDLTEPTLLVTYHPVTLEYEDTGMHVHELLAALEKTEFAVVFTYPNADTHSRLVIDMINEFAARHAKYHALASLGTQIYFSLMRHAVTMVGNSSSGIIEAASFKLPVVNIGNRQRGRVHGKNVVDVGYGRTEIIEGITRAVSPGFRAGLEDIVNPYGNGYAAERIVEELREVQLDNQFLMKRFYDIGR